MSSLLPSPDAIVDVTIYYNWPGVLKAERKGCNTLILTDLGGPNNAAFAESERDNPYELIYRWHSSPTSPQSSVSGSEVSYFSEDEVKGWQEKSLFDLFQLF